MRILTAEQGKVFAYRDELGNEIILGDTLYLGKNDDGKRYYQINTPTESIWQKTFVKIARQHR